MGKPQPNKARNPGTGGRRQPAGGKRATTRSSKSQLTNGLEDPAQVERDLAQQLKSMGLYAANTMGDGNCLWRALSDQLYGTPGLHFSLRQEVCDHLEVFPEKYAGFVDNDKPFHEYVALMRQNGTYGGHLELSAFAQLKQKVVKVVQPGLVYLVSGDDEGVRERKEKEREIAQSKSQPGSEGPPPTEREQRRLRRAARARSSSPVKQAMATKQEREAEEEAGPSNAVSQDQGPIEAFGPLYIAYHNWEHYSSVRNLAGPHQGLPRIQVLPSITDSDPSSSSTKGKAALGKKKSQVALPEDEDWVPDDDPEPTQDEALVLQSCPGHDLQVVRQMIHAHGDWESAVEALIAQDSGELLESPVASGSSRLSKNGKLLRPNPLPDHLRQYRATSPASVETNGTRSSEGSTSTAATTEELSPVDDNSRSASPMTMPRHKRAASSDIMSASMTRSPKRRSRSRSPIERKLDDGNGGQADSDSDSRRASMDIQVSNSDHDGFVEQESAPSQSSGSANTSTTARGTPSSTSRTPPKNARLTARQKRDAEQQRKRERNQAKVLGKAAGKGENSNSRASTAEVKGFIELKI